MVNPDGTEAGLRESERRFRCSFEHAPIGMALVDLDGRLRQVNEALCRFLGRPRAALEGRHVRDISHPEDQAEDQRNLDRLLREDCASYAMEKRYVHASGAFVWGRLSVALLQDSDGQPCHLICHVEDIHQRKQMAEELQRSEERYRRLVENSHDVIYTVAADGTITFASASLTKVLGHPRGAVVGRHYQEFLHPEDHAYCEGVLQGILTQARPVAGVEHRILHADGSWRQQVSNLTPVFEEDGQVREVVGSTRDITEQRAMEAARERLEQQLQRSQKLEALGLLAGGIAHDFNNLLMAVLGHAELATAKLPAAAPVRENLRQIEAAAHRGAELCQQMLAYAGRSTGTARPVDLHGLLQEAAALLGASVSKKIRLVLAPGSGVPYVLGDPGRIHQVLLNLIINAAEAIGDREGSIRVATRFESWDGERLRDAVLGEGLAPGPYVILEVSDNGAGMDAATQARLFEPFFSTKFTGRGLGIAVVLGIMRAHRGAIRVTSAPGEGSVFSLLFPPAEPGTAVDGSAAREVAPAREASGTVLLVDDEPMLRNLGTEMLETMGFQVITAGDGREAVALFGQHRGSIQLVLMDLTMPGMDGAEALAAMRGIDAKVPVLIASGYSDRHVVGRLAELGEVPRIQKPYEYETLRAALARLMAHAAPL